MDPRKAIREAAGDVQLDLLGFARVDELGRLPDSGFYGEWLERGFAGEMNYLKGERAERRGNPKLVLSGACSVICVALNYNAAAPRSTECPDPRRAWISRYAWGSDYHEVLREKLDLMLEGMRARIPESFQARCYVDTGPVLERAFTRQTAIGWMGKNTCMIHQQLGSWLFLGEILTTLDIPKDEPAADRCGSCTRCIDACPTQALIAPRVLDSTRCISYWTIEAKDEAFRPDVAAGLGRHVFGCDICQDVCPWNRRAPVTTISEFQPRAGLMNPPLEELARLSEEEFRVLFRNSPVRRLGYRRFQRNVAAAIDNARATA
jgi:epoxyqueuosine reductase